MTKNILVISALLISLASAANAQSEKYECQAKANPERGLDFDFTISASPAKVGGNIVMTADFGQKIIGVISEVGTLNKATAKEAPAFEATLGYIGEEDVSGIAEKNLSQVTAIEIIKTQTADGDEASIFKLFAGDKQIGGTILISGMATACLPKQ